MSGSIAVQFNVVQASFSGLRLQNQSHLGDARGASTTTDTADESTLELAGMN